MTAPRLAARALLGLAAAPLAAACVSIEDPTGTWQPAADIAGALAVEVGPEPAAPPLDPPAAGRLRVASWNVHFGADPGALAEAIRSSDALATADVLLIQEIEAYPDEPATRAARLAGALGMTWAYAPAREEGDGTHGIAILSRRPLEDVRVMQLPYVDQPIRARPRIALAADLVIGGQRIPIVDVHLDVRIGAVDRVRQLYPAVADLPAAAIVGGDFNSNPWAWLGATVPLASDQAVVDQDQAALIDDFMDALGFAGAIAADASTLRAPLVEIRLDDIYARGLPLAGGAVADGVDGSDHWPIWADVGLN